MEASANTASSGIGVPLVGSSWPYALYCTSFPSRAIATTAPGTRLAAISRAKKSSRRARPCCENPTSSGFASGSGAAFAALAAMPAAIIAAAFMNAFIVFSLACGSSRTIIMVGLSCLDYVCKGDKPSAGSRAVMRLSRPAATCCAWQEGQITQKPVQPFAQKYSAFASRANHSHNSACLTADEGRWRSSRTRGEMRWTLRARLDVRAGRVRRSRVVRAPRCWR